MGDFDNVILFRPRPNPNREKEQERQAMEIMNVAFPSVFNLDGSDGMQFPYVAEDKDPA
jgi:hypothetical protein